MILEDDFDIHRASGSRPDGPKRVRSVMVNGKMMDGKELEEYTKKKGLCPICAETKVKEKVKKRGLFKYEMEAITIEDDKHEGEYLVYNGYCLGALCYTLEQAMKESGEIDKHASVSQAAKQVKNKKQELRRKQRSGGHASHIMQPTEEDTSGGADDDSGEVLNAEVHIANQKPAAGATTATDTVSHEIFHGETGHHRRDHSASQWSSATPPEFESWFTPEQHPIQSPAAVAAATANLSQNIHMHHGGSSHQRDNSAASAGEIDNRRDSWVTPDQYARNSPRNSSRGGSSNEGLMDEIVFRPAGIPTLPDITPRQNVVDNDNATTSDTSNQSSKGNASSNSNYENRKPPPYWKSSQEDDSVNKSRQSSGRSLYSDTGSNDERSRQSSKKSYHDSDSGINYAPDRPRQHSRPSRTKSAVDIIFVPPKATTNSNDARRKSFLDTPPNVLPGDPKQNVVNPFDEQGRNSAEVSTVPIQFKTRRPSRGPGPEPDFENIPQERRGTTKSKRSSIDESIKLPVVAEMTRDEAQAISELELLAERGDYHKLINDCLCANWAVSIVVQRAFELLRNGIHVMHRQTGGYVFRSTPWVKFCLSSMDNNRKNLKVQAEGVLLFWSAMSVDTKYMDDISKSSCIDTVLKLMDRSVSDSENGYTHNFEEESIFIQYACGFLECLTYNEKYGLNVRHPSINKVITALTNVVNKYDIVGGNGTTTVSDRPAKHLAIRALYNLSYHDELSERICRNMSDSNTVDGLTFIIKNEKTDVDTVEWAIRLLWRLSCCSCLSMVDNGAVVMASEDLIDALLVTMNVFDTKTLHEAACGLLFSLAKDQQRMLRGPTSSIAEAIILTAKNEYDVLDVQLVCINVLNALCSDKEKCEVVAETDAVSVVVDAMKKYRHHAELQVAASMTLANLALNDERSRSSIASCNGVHALVDAFHTFGVDNDDTSLHPESADMVIDGTCAALAALSMSPLASETIKDLGMLFEMMKFWKRRKSQKMSPHMITLLINIMTFSGQMNVQGERDGNGAISILMIALQNVQTAEEAETLMNSFVSMSLKSPDVMDNIMAHDGGDGILHILRVLETFAQSGSVQKSGCVILNNIYLKIPYNGTLDQIAEVKRGSTTVKVTTHTAREVKILLSAMEYHKNNESIQTYACDALCNFIVGSVDPVVCSDVGKTDEVVRAYSGCLQRVNDVMSIHDKSLDLQKSILRLLWVLVFLNDEVELNRLSSHLSEKIIKTMGLFKEDEELCLNACGVLAVLVEVEEAARSIGQIDGIRILIGCLQFENKGVVELSSRILATLLQQVFTVGNDFMEIDDAIPNVIYCMMNNSNSPEILLHGCSVLASLADLHETSVKALIAGNGGLNACINAIKCHGQNEAVVAVSCRALSGIVPGADPAIIRDMRKEIGGLLMGVLNDHLRNPEVMQALIAALFGLCERDDEFKSYIADANGIPSIIEAMSLHLRNEPCQHVGCSLFWMLSSYGPNKRKIGSAGIRVIVNAMFSHISSTGLQIEALTALKNLASEADLKSAIRSHGGIDAIVSSLWVNMNSHTLVCAAFSALNNIAVNSETRAVSRVEHGELSVICFAMKKFPYAVEVQKCACFLLRTYTFEPYNLTVLKQQEDLLALLTAAADTFPSECGERASFILSNI